MSRIFHLALGVAALSVGASDPSSRGVTIVAPTKASQVSTATGSSRVLRRLWARVAGQGSAGGGSQHGRPHRCFLMYGSDRNHDRSVLRPITLFSPAHGIRGDT